MGVGSYPSAEMQTVYSTTPADWAKSWVLRYDASQVRISQWCGVMKVTIYRLCKHENQGVFQPEIVPIEMLGN